MRLSPDHQLELLGGRPLLGTRLTRDLLPVLRWDREIGRWAASIGPATPPQWNDTLNHLALFSRGLHPIGAGDDLQPQEEALLEDMAGLSSQLDQARRLLQLLEPDADGPDLGQPAGLVQRLSRIGGADFRSVYQSVRSAYLDYRELESDLATLRRLAQLGQSVEEIQRAIAYLEDAAVPPHMSELSVQRQTLRVALSPGSLLRSARSWNALEQETASFKARYAAAYRAHHEGLHQSLASYKLDLDEARRKLRALGLLNTLAELGAPEGAGLAESLADMPEGPPLCLLGPEALDLETSPWCQSCAVLLEQSLPGGEMARLLASIDHVLGEKNRRLSNLLVEKILQSQGDQRLDDFLKIVQASDLSAISDTLSPELVAFIRGILG